MKILVTGNLGYVGNALTNILKKNDFEVIGCDVGFFPQGFIDSNPLKIDQINKDIREISENDLKGVSAICHLAALSNDPLGEINPNLTNEINYLATVNLAKIAKKANVERFVFSSSCSSYGANDDVVNESSPVLPLTSYAKSKVNSEKELLLLGDKNFCVTNLRSATAYGLSDSFRLDLVVNNLTASAVSTGDVKLLSDGTSWRPLVHVEDMANAFTSVLNSDVETVSNETFNVGSNDENYTVREIAEKIEDIVPNSKIVFGENANKDARSYRVDFTKIKDQIGFKTKWKLKNGIHDIFKTVEEKQFTEDDFSDKKFYRIKHLNWLLDQKLLDQNLYFQTQ